ncbi:MAG: flotillin family protein [Oscillospiraceae bacterium]|nr:flotillin family protein [Oscillospiraceae bacterium]
MLWIILGLLVVLFFVVMLIGYKKAPPDTAYIISGLRKKIVIGRAAVRIPFFERLDRLSLKLIPVDVKTSSAVPTADYINITVDAVVNVKISTEGERIKVAAENFLNQDTVYIGSVAREVLEGNMREIVGKMRLEEMVSDRQKFAELVRANADPDLAAMGLDIVSFNVQNFADTNGVIDDLGIDNISQIKKKAAIAKAEANKEIAIANSEAERQANEARVNAEREIATKNNELALQQAALKKAEDTARAEADAAYEIQKQEQRKTIEVASADADIAAQERAIELEQRKAEVEEQRLDAEIKKRADAALYQRQKEAEAQKFETERKAEAEKFAKQQEAEGIRMVGQAEADAIKLKGIAEAEAMRRKAEAYKEYTGAAMAEMIIHILPELAGKIAQPLSQIDKITIVGGGDSANGVNNVAGNVPLVMAQLFETVKETTGIDLQELVRAESYDAKVNRHVTVDGTLPMNDAAQAVVADAVADTLEEK